MVSELTWDDDGMGGWLLSETAGRVSASVFEEGDRAEDGPGWIWSVTSNGWDVARGKEDTAVAARLAALDAVIQWANRQQATYSRLSDAAGLLMERL